MDFLEKNQKKISIAIFALSMLSILALEIFSRTSLFDYVLYTNSSHIDFQMDNLQARTDWSILAIGSSEVRYGFDPIAFEDELRKSGSHSGPVFNLGIDGFNLGVYRHLLPYLGFQEEPLKNVEVVLIGVNLTEMAHLAPLTADAGFNCETSIGILQRALFTSSFISDRGGKKICTKSHWLDPVEDYFGKFFYFVRYRRPLRHLIMGNEDVIKSDELRQTDRGFHYRDGMTEEKHYFEFKRYANDIKDTPADKLALNETRWRKSFKPGQIYDKWMEFFIERDIEPIFFALPTNPEMTRMLNRIESYEPNSEYFANWAESRDVVFIDLGQKMDYHRLQDFADRRHLSKRGANKFSRELARAIGVHLN